MTEFVIEVPDENFAFYSTETVIRAGNIMSKFKQKGDWYNKNKFQNKVFDRYITVYQAKNAPSEVVAILTAMARRDPLEPILDKIEGSLN